MPCIAAGAELVQRHRHFLHAGVEQFQRLPRTGGDRGFRIGGPVRVAVELIERLAQFLHEGLHQRVLPLQHALAAGETFVLFVGSVRMVGEREELFLEFADAAAHGFVQTFHAQGVGCLDQLLGARRPPPLVELGGAAQCRHASPVLSDVHAKPVISPGWPSLCCLPGLCHRPERVSRGSWRSRRSGSAGPARWSAGVARRRAASRGRGRPSASRRSSPAPVRCVRGNRPSARRRSGAAR